MEADYNGSMANLVFEASFREEIAAVKAEIAAHRAETKVIKWLLGILYGLTFMLGGRMFEIF